jgi:hypothetical protein
MARMQITQLNKELRRKIQVQVQRLAAAANLSDNVLEIARKILSAS